MTRPVRKIRKLGEWKVSCLVDSIDNREIIRWNWLWHRIFSFVRYPSLAIRGVTNDYPRKER